MLKSSAWTKFACVLCLFVSQVVNGGSSNNRNDGNGISSSSSGSASSNNLLNGLPSSNINVVAPSPLVGEPKAIGNNNWYQAYGSPYTVVAQPIARDSYADSATNLGYGAPVGGGGHEGGYAGGGGSGGYGGGGGGGGGGGYDSGQQTTYHYQLYPAGGGGGYGGSGHSGGYGVVDDDDDDGGGSGAIGLLGLLGLKGLKGVKAIKAIKKAVVLGPILFPILLPILAPLLLLLAAPLLLLLLPLLLFLPIPVITVPATGRGLTMLKETARIAHNVATTEECIERISCEAFRVARGYGYDAPWVKSFLEKSASKSKWIERVSRGLKTTECKKYSCDQVTSLKRSLKLGKE